MEDCYASVEGKQYF